MLFRSQTRPLANTMNSVGYKLMWWVLEQAIGVRQGYCLYGILCRSRFLKDESIAMSSTGKISVKVNTNSYRIILLYLVTSQQP